AARGRAAPPRPVSGRPPVPCDPGGTAPSVLNTRWSTASSCAFLLGVAGPFGGQRLEAGRLKGDRQFPLGAVVLDALDQQPQDTGLLVRRQRLPARLEQRQGRRRLLGGQQVFPRGTQLLADFANPRLDTRDALLQFGQAGDGRTVVAARAQAQRQVVDLALP